MKGLWVFSRSSSVLLQSKNNLITLARDSKSIDRQTDRQATNVRHVTQMTDSDVKM